MKRHTATELERLAIERGGKVVGVRPPAVKAWNPADPTCSVLVLEDWVPPALNRIMRGKIRARISEGRDCHARVLFEAIRQEIPKAMGARRVGLVVDYPSVRLIPDPDAIQKAVGDALKNAGLLLDDCYSLCEWNPPVYWLGPKRTEIHLWDIPEKIIKARQG